MSKPSVEEHMDVEILYQDSMMIVAGTQSPWTRRRKVALAELVNEHWALLPHESIVGSTVLEAFRANGLEPPRATVVTLSLSMRESLLSTGLFLSVLPDIALKFFTKQAAIKVLPVELPTTRRPIGLITLKNRALSPMAELFIRCTRDVVKSINARPQTRK